MVLERLILTRFNRPGEVGVCMTCNQNRFKCRGTAHAIKEVLNIAESVIAAGGREEPLCLLVVLDVRNTFNTAPWEAIDVALRKLRILKYLMMLRSYMENRMILIPEDIGYSD